MHNCRQLKIAEDLIQEYKMISKCLSSIINYTVVSVFTGRMPFLPPNQQRQSTEVVSCWHGYLSGERCK